MKTPALARRCSQFFLTPLAFALLTAYPLAAQDTPADVQQLRQMLEEESVKLEELSRSLEEQDKRLRADRQTLEEQKRRIRELEKQLGVTRAPTPAPPQQAQPAQAPSAPPPTVGQAPQRTDTKPPEVAPLFQAPGVLTPKGRLVLEPSIQYDYSSNNRIAVVGFTIIPAIVIGLLDIRTVNRTTWTAALTARYGITNRMEIEGRVPYVSRRDTTVTRPAAPATTDETFGSSGEDIGDVELTARYQLNDGGVDKPYYIGSLRVKTRTGTSPFEVPLIPGTILESELPTGSGFYGLQVGLTTIYPSDPAVFFGGVTYLHNFARDVGGTLGHIDPGDIFGLNFGLGLGLNEKASFSIGYEHNYVDKVEQNGAILPGTTSIQLGTLSLGYSYRGNNKTTWNWSLGIGVTKDTPDVTLRLRVPMSVK